MPSRQPGSSNSFIVRIEKSPMSSAISYATTDAGEIGSIRPVTVLYLGCPQPARPDVEKQLAAVRVAVVWADSSLAALAELQRRDLPVVADFARGGAILEPLARIAGQTPGDAARRRRRSVSSRFRERGRPGAVRPTC